MARAGPGRAGIILDCVGGGTGDGVPDGWELISRGWGDFKLLVQVPISPLEAH